MLLTPHPPRNMCKKSNRCVPQPGQHPPWTMNGRRRRYHGTVLDTMNEPRAREYGFGINPGREVVGGCRWYPGFGTMQVHSPTLTMPARRRCHWTGRPRPPRLVTYRYANGPLPGGPQPATHHSGPRKPLLAFSIPTGSRAAATAPPPEFQVTATSMIAVMAFSWIMNGIDWGRRYLSPLIILFIDRSGDTPESRCETSRLHRSRRRRLLGIFSNLFLNPNC